jgi:hypothetical protein
MKKARLLFVTLLTIASPSTTGCANKKFIKIGSGSESRSN